ncbi:uncharacterized protein LOC124170148 isoform X3 [Ischnura elegans]|uniref:uncharacterized protein LOC124170148 isoform X3 n=1 Tax=Ischnura elegans TaxID=197161 RepID=UPI001ED87992|nr:uncharacterized protein LOC124170148 isoform X3 [Ischnura elegans]
METPVLGYGPNVGESHICRLCMKSHAYYLNVFVSSEQFKMPIGKVIEDLLMLEVAEGDSLPATVCCPCVTKLMDFREFKEMCVYSARELSRSEPFPCPVKVEIIEEDDTVEPCAGSGLADWNDEFIKDGSGQPVHSKGRIADHENDGADGNGEDDGNDDTRGVVVKKEYNERATVFIESAAVAMREECLVDEEDVERGADDGVVQSVVVKREYGDGATVFIESAAVEMRDEFVVVKFQGEDVDGVEFFAAPTKWIHFSEKDGPPTAKEEVQIYWPPQSTPPNLVTKMARKETGPQSDWTLHSAILKRYYGTLDVVLRELGSQRKMISLLNSKMDILVVNQAQTNRTLTPALKRVERPPNLPPFPVTSHAKLEKVERFLDNKSNFAATMDYLSCYVLQDDAKSISVMMGKIMTNKLAVEFNYNGKPPKEAFNKLRLKEVILGAILLKHPESDLVVAESAIKNWRKYAKKRKQEGDDDEDDEYDDEDDYDDIELNGRL